MKVGDKVYCIKDNISDAGEEYEHVYHLNGNVYTILRCNSKLIYTTTENQYGDEYYSWYVESNEYKIFSNYFITEKEQRKLKLEKLNEKSIMY